MIELPDWAVPSAAEPRLMDFGGVIRPSSGAAIQKIDRPGSRFAVALGFPPFKSKDKGRIMVSRLLAAKREGLRIKFPLLSAHQGYPGSPVVDGDGQSGRSIDLRDLTPNYAFKEGFWLSIENAAGQHFLHNCRSNVVASLTGLATITIDPALRYEFADGDSVHIAQPMVEGLVTGEEWGWQMTLAHHQMLSVEIEEAA